MRLSYLFKELKSAYPNDEYLKNLEETQKISKDFIKSINAYNRALSRLDNESWEVLKEKAIEKFKSTHELRVKHQFYNLLNEAFAYRHLLNNGYIDIAFAKENKKHKTPDIFYKSEYETLGCEIKTIDTSEKMLIFYKKGKSYDSNKHHSLSPAFFKQLNEAIVKAFKQIKSNNIKGIAFIIINFDDFTLVRYQEYKYEISKFLKKKFPNDEIFIKISIFGKKHIHHNKKP